MSRMHLLVASEGAVLLDTGFPGDTRRIRHVMAKVGISPTQVRAILLTHGHIDHAGNAAELKAWTGAPIYAHPLEQAHLDGTHRYTGAARVCGVLETVARAVAHYRAPKIDVETSDGQLLPFWGGLRVVHLPGHTIGHCGFYSQKHDLLFSGDLWARVLRRTQISPRIFSDEPARRLESIRKARAIGARWVVPGHYDHPNATMLRARFERLCDEIEPRNKPHVV